LTRPAVAPLTVLVVDDYPDGLELVTTYLTFRGFRVHTATSGEEAIAVARAAMPHVVLMDLTMPSIDGWQATRILKGDPQTRGIHVIAVTAHALPDEVESARRAGCEGVISMPFDLATLADALPRFLVHGPSALDVPGLSAGMPPAALRRRNAEGV